MQPRWHPSGLYWRRRSPSTLTQAAGLRRRKESVFYLLPRGAIIYWIERQDVFLFRYWMIPQFVRESIASHFAFALTGPVGCDYRCMRYPMPSSRNQWHPQGHNVFDASANIDEPIPGGTNSTTRFMIPPNNMVSGRKIGADEFKVLWSASREPGFIWWTGHLVSSNFSKSPLYLISHLIMIATFLILYLVWWWHGDSRD